MFQNPAASFSSYQQRGRRMKTVVQDASIAMNVNLTVHDKDGNERREVYMGDWIQLRSFLHSSSGEYSFCANINSRLFTSSV